MRKTLIAAAAAMTATLAGAMGPAAGQMIERGGDTSAFALGTLAPADGAMERDLWTGSDADTVRDLLSATPTQFSNPLHLDLLRRVTLSPGAGPDGATDALAAEKFWLAAQAGFYEDAASLAELVPSLNTQPGLSKVTAYSALMQGETETACARGAMLTDGREDSFWVKLRYICYIRAGETAAADLTWTLLQRQGGLSVNEEELFTQFRDGRITWSGDAPTTVFEAAIMREAGGQIAPDALATAHPGMIAAVARDGSYPEEMREQALILAMQYGTIRGREARRLVEAMPTSSLAAALLSVIAQADGSLEHYQAMATALVSAQNDWPKFKALSHLFAEDLRNAAPVVNFATAADVIALAAMVTELETATETWILAVANETLDPTAAQRATALIDIYSRHNVGGARRLASYLNLPANIPPLTITPLTPVETTTPLPAFVEASLRAARAEGAGPAALIYLTGLTVDIGAEGQLIHETVTDWAFDHAALNWLHTEAQFEADARSYLAVRDFSAMALEPQTGDVGALTPSLKPRDL